MSLTDSPDSERKSPGGSVEHFPIVPRRPQTTRPVDKTRRYRVRPELVTACLMVAEAGSIVLAASITRLIDLGAQPVAQGEGLIGWGAATVLGLATALLAVLSLSVTGAYARPVVLSVGSCRRPVLLGLSLAFAILVAVQWALTSDPAPRMSWIGLWLVLAAAGLLAIRKIVQLTMRALSAEGNLKRRSVVFVSGTHGDTVLSNLHHLRDEIEVIAVFQDDTGTRKAEAHAGGAVQDLVAYAQASDCDQVILAIAGTETALLDRIVDATSVLPCEIIACPALLQLQMPAVQMQQMGQLVACRIQSRPLEGTRWLAKSIFDRCAAAVALVLLSPLFLAIAIAIRHGSKGPVFFRQQRNGYNQGVIRVYKFRTMTVMEDGPVVQQAKADDRRVTSVGRLLRRSSLDELPQLINVLKGEMSLVGPRPHAVAHNRQYGAVIDHYASRHRVKPGITGWAQVNGFRGETKDAAQMRARVEHDLYYIENHSLLLDLKIMLMTVVTVVSGTNAH